MFDLYVYKDDEDFVVPDCTADEVADLLEEHEDALGFQIVPG